MRSAGTGREYQQGPADCRQERQCALAGSLSRVHPCACAPPPHLPPGGSAAGSRIRAWSSSRLCIGRPAAHRVLAYRRIRLPETKNPQAASASHIRRGISTGPGNSLPAAGGRFPQVTNGKADCRKGRKHRHPQAPAPRHSPSTQAPQAPQVARRLPWRLSWLARTPTQRHCIRHPGPDRSRTATNRRYAVTGHDELLRAPAMHWSDRGAEGVAGMRSNVSPRSRPPSPRVPQAPLASARYAAQQAAASAIPPSSPASPTRHAPS